MEWVAIEQGRQAEEWTIATYVTQALQLQLLLQLHLTIDVYIQLFAVPHTSERRPGGAAWEYSQATPMHLSHTQRGMCGEGRHGLEHRSGLGVFAGQT